MSRAYTTIRDLAEQILEDTGNADWATTELDLLIPIGLNEISRYKPYETVETFQIETRNGTANSDIADALVDTTKSQFLSTDVDKVVYNVDDKTWAVVTSATTSQLTLSKDIFPDGNEQYKIFNAGCRSNREINIVGVPDYLIIKKLVYPPGKTPNWTQQGDIIWIDMPSAPDDTRLSTADKDVDVYFARPHFLSELTDFLGKVSVGVAAGVTTFTLDIVDGANVETIKRNQPFTIAGIRGTYHVTVDATFVAGVIAISFYPALQSASLANDVVTLEDSTLTLELEDILANWVAAQAALNRCSDLARNQMVTGTAPFQAMRQWALDKMALVNRELASQSKRKRPARQYAFSKYS